MRDCAPSYSNVNKLTENEEIEHMRLKLIVIVSEIVRFTHLNLPSTTNTPFDKTIGKETMKF